MDAATIAAATASLCLMAACGEARSGDTARAATAIGVNVHTIEYWDGSRPFMNLIYGSDWQMQATAGWEDVPASNLDANGWIRSLPAGYQAERILSMPASSTDVVCHWQGNDNNSMAVAGAVASNFRRTARSNEIRFRYTSTYPNVSAWAFLSYKVDPSNYVRNIDCREDSASSNALFDPVLVSTLRGFRVVRFMKWQPAVEANRTITWARRNKPGDGTYLRNDGVPIEQMMALANQAGADPWFCMPWNADDDYVTRFAAYVRDNLPRGGKVYVEVSNEVWNAGYPVMHQARDEGVAEGLDAGQGTYGQAMYRYAEKTRHVMQIWSSVFNGQSERLVRIISGQNVSPFWTRQLMGYGKTAQSVDALATAPYWAFHDADYTGQSLDEIMNSVLPARVNESLNWAAQQKAIAQKFGKRYIAYEGGQDVLLKKNMSLVAQIERDPRMSDLYKSYIIQWNASVGDALTLFALTGPIGTGGYGLVEYAGQPLTQAPKMRAVRNFIRPRI
jgi:hypothetical protein